jgi:hypothetical protein
MTSSIPKELIDALPRHFIVAAKVHMGKSKLIRALGNEVFKKYNLESWTYVGETGINNGSTTMPATTTPENIEAADLKNMLYMYDGYAQPPKDADYGASIYSAMVVQPINFDGQSTTAPLRETRCACPLGVSAIGHNQEMAWPEHQPLHFPYKGT